MSFAKRSLFVVLLAVAGSASADPIYWNTWTSASSGSLVANGEVIAVTFATANPHAAIANYPSWTPLGTFADGSIVDNGPVPANGIMQLLGGSSADNTLSFSTAVVDPVISIWSLGQGGGAASFVFTATPMLIAGGPSAEYGGSALLVSGNTVTGNEGNGTIQFKGSFASISWTNPIFENWYGFNVGVAAAVPEPSTAALLLLGLLPVALGLRKRSST